MNNINWLHRIKSKVDWHNQLLINIVFVGLIFIFVWSLYGYWQNSLKPRLYTTAETQANILAESQAANLLEILSHTQPEHLRQTLANIVQKILIVEDPAIGERFIYHVALQLDYSFFDLPFGSLDLSEGEKNCQQCFVTDVPLINHQGELLGLATFALSDSYFQQLSHEMKSKLIAESMLTLVVLIAVWVFVTFTFYRLNRTKRIIEASDRAKTRFMANVTHELRTPLNAILGNTQLFKQNTELMLNHGHGVNAISRNAEHLLTMINDILEFSVADEEHLTLHCNKVNFKQFLMNIVEMAQVSAQVKNLQFRYHFDTNLPTYLELDDKRLRQVLLNLLSNAVKFTKNGHVSLSVKLMAKSATECTVVFTVEDTGMGIDKEQLTNIFIPFKQLENNITRAEGTGLGLAISQKIVTLMASKIVVSSEEGTGSTFKFELLLPIIDDITTASETVVETDDVVSLTKLLLPTQAQIEELIEQSRNHNVLGVRSLIKELETSQDMQPFLQKIEPFVKNYRFKLLAEWLITLEINKDDH